MLHVPYRANPLAVADLLGGQISVVFLTLSTTPSPDPWRQSQGLESQHGALPAVCAEPPTMIEQVSRITR